MPILVDSNVILDVTSDDPVWSGWSDAQITRHQGAGLMINAVIYAELCAGASTVAAVNQVLVQLKLELRELSREAFFLAAQTFLKYRRQGGTKTSTLPDFFIGAQAEVLGIPLLTRDQARYKTYFPTVPLICP